MLLDSEGKLIRGQERWVRDAAKTPLVVADATVGYIAIAPGPTLADLGEINFLERQHGTLALIAIAIFVGAALLAYMLAGRLTRPIGRLRAVTHQLTQGDYEARTQLLRDDEIGALAADVDGLAATLEKHERDRRQWIADIAHELRTPLAVMRAQLEAVEDGVRPLSNSLITSLHGDVERLSRLVNDLHELTVTDLGKMSFNLVPLRLGELLHNELNECLPAESTDGIDASFDLAAVGDVHILGDAGRISQLVRNLVSNTLRYTDRPGKLRVTARRTEENIYITFDDSAPGVPEASFAHLFERLYRVDPSRNRDTGGAGLGLAICRNIVDAHQGSITASASPLGGLRIEITFPWNPTADPYKAQTMSEETKRVLVVEDETTLANVLADYLSAAGYNAHQLYRGDEAVEWVKEHRPHLILLDLMLPGLDGIEVCKQVRAFTETPIIMTTARVDEVDRLVGLELGADDYICKPYSPREVVARVKAVLRRVSAATTVLTESTTAPVTFG